MSMTGDDVLQRRSPEQQGVNSSAILRFIEALESRIHELHSFMLLRHGSVIAEGWWSPYGREHPHMLYSLSKSFTSTAVGLAVTEGCFSLDDRVLSFFPDEKPAEVNEHLTEMQVRHLLSMSTGHDVDTWSFMVERADGGWIKAFFEVPVLHPPGTHFLYNTGATYVLAAIVQKATGMKMLDYLQPRLFETLGIGHATWEESPEGIALGGIGLNLKTEDIARFGQFYLQKGVWQGNRILPEAWVEQATAHQISNGDLAESDWTQGYGYQFWRCRHNAYRGDGAFGQYCIVMPEQDAVLAITGGVDLFDMQEPLNLVWEMLLPAMHDAPLPEDVTAYERLKKKLSGLTLSPVQGNATSPLIAEISDHHYRFDANELTLETMTLSFNESGSDVRMKTAQSEERFSCGYGEWLFDQSSLFSDTKTPIAASGAWTADDRFTMVVRLYHMPFFHTLDCHFSGDELMVETRVNVSFDAPKTLLLTAARK
jgi:CubicO group peptidase (beta-lactamase class C family)